MATNKQPLAILLYSGNFDRVHYGLAIASAAAAIDRPVTLFVTMGACKAFAHRHDGSKRWGTMPLSTSMDSIAVKTPNELNRYFGSQDIATFEELLQACVDLNVKFMICEMGLRAMGVSMDRLFKECKFIEGGLVTFLSEMPKDLDIITL